MPEDLPVTRRLTIPGAELSERFSRSGGPGGQGVDTADSLVELSWDVAASSVPANVRDLVLTQLAGRLVDGVLIVAAREHRTQLANRRAARLRLAELVGRAATPPAAPRRATRPTRGSRDRRLAAKKLRGDVKRGRAGGWS